MAHLTAVDASLDDLPLVTRPYAAAGITEPAVLTEPRKAIARELRVLNGGGAADGSPA